MSLPLISNSVLVIFPQWFNYFPVEVFVRVFDFLTLKVYSCSSSLLVYIDQHFRILKASSSYAQAAIGDVLQKVSGLQLNRERGSKAGVLLSVLRSF